MEYDPCGCPVQATSAGPTDAQTAVGRRPRLVREQPGQSLVELALVLPVLLLLVLAAVDLGRIFFARIAVANAAREGAYEASYRGTYVANSGCSDTNSVMCAILNEAQSSLSIAPADVAWACNNAGGCAPGGFGDRVTIKVTGHFELLTPILAAFFGGTNIAFSSSASADIVATDSAGVAPTVAACADGHSQPHADTHSHAVPDRDHVARPCGISDAERAHVQLPGGRLRMVAAEQEPARDLHQRLFAHDRCLCDHVLPLGVRRTRQHHGCRQPADHQPHVRAPEP